MLPEDGTLEHLLLKIFSTPMIEFNIGWDSVVLNTCQIVIYPTVHKYAHTSGCYLIRATKLVESQRPHHVLDMLKSAIYYVSIDTPHKSETLFLTYDQFIERKVELKISATLAKLNDIAI